MMILLEIALVGVLALLNRRFVEDPTRGRVFNAIKAYLTVRVFWLLFTHEFTLEDGSVVMIWDLIKQQLANIDAATFWTFLLLGTGVKVIGMLSSMYRWVLVLRGQGIELPFRHIFGAFLIGRFIGTFLPSTAGLDGYTLFDASRFSGKTVEAAAAKFLEKICGFSGVFLTFLVSLPFGISIFGENALLFAALSIPIAVGIIGGLLLVLWYPGAVQWLLENLPIPAKERLYGVLTRISAAAGAYRDKKGLMVMVLFMSFMVHFTTAVLYYFTALAIGATGADFWQVTFGSSIQIFATVISPFTIAGEGIREAAQLVLLGNLIGPGAAIVSAALGFWAAEAPTMLGVIFWWMRGKDYRPDYCLVDGQQVDYEAAAKAAASLETEEERAAREARGAADGLMPIGARVMLGAGLGFGSGVIAGIVIGVTEGILIVATGELMEGQVLWYGALAYSAVLGGLGVAGGAVLGVLPMEREEMRGWVPTLGLVACLVPMGLFITVFRLKRDMFQEQMPPVGVLLGVLATFGVVALAILWFGRSGFAGRAGAVFKPLIAVALLVAVMVLGALAGLTQRGESSYVEAAGVPKGLEDQPNVILVMMDTLRADRLECYGYEHTTTPNICSLAEDGGSIYQGFAHASWTKPSTATILTSLLPSTHRAMSKPSILSDEVEMISETMKRRGYATGGVVSNINLAESFGFRQGFDEYYFLGPSYLFGADESSSKLVIYNIGRIVAFKVKKGLSFDEFYQDSQVVNEVTFDWLDRHKSDRFFLLVHYMDVHDPYFEHPYNGHAIARVSNQHPDAALAAEMQRLYEGEIDYLDENFGELLDKLKSLGLYEDSVIALVSDHGEEFHEHGGWWHGTTLYEEQIHVPFLIKWAKSQGRPSGESERGLARMLDVAPTLIASTDTEIPAVMQGIDLRARGAGLAEKHRQVFAEEDHEGNVLWAMRTEEHKLIKANAGNPRGLPETELFDIAADPKEERPLDGNAYANVRRELTQYADLQKRAAEGEAVADAGEASMSLEECEQLRLLGYVDDCSHLHAKD